MSVRNKSQDRDAQGKIKAQYRGKPCYYTMNTPSWWTRLHMTRPRRQQNHRLCHAVERGADAEALVFPLDNHKPHEYYW